MSTHETYIKNDIDRYVDLDAADEFPTYARRMDVLEFIFPEEAEIHTYRAGYYDGEMLIIVELADYVWLTHDWYGTCSGCDQCAADPYAWGSDIIRDFYCFENAKDALQYVDNTDDFGMQKADLRDGGREILARIRDQS